MAASYIKNIRPARAVDIFNRLASSHSNNQHVLGVAAQIMGLPYNKQIVMDFNQEDGDI